MILRKKNEIINKQQKQKFSFWPTFSFLRLLRAIRAISPSPTSLAAPQFRSFACSPSPLGVGHCENLDFIKKR